MTHGSLPAEVCWNVLCRKAFSAGSHNRTPGSVGKRERTQPPSNDLILWRHKPLTTHNLHLAGGVSLKDRVCLEVLNLEFGLARFCLMVLV